LNRRTVAWVSVVTIALAAAGGALLYLLPHPSLQGSFGLEFGKTGGIAGVNDTLVVRDDASATLSSRYGASFDSTVGAVEFSELKHVIAASLGDTSPGTFQARAGTADYFGYRLAVTTDTGTTVLLWVDQWAVNGTFPQGLSAIQGEVQKLMTDLTVRHSYANANASEAGGLRMTILTDKSSYKAGDQVNIAVILENTGSSNVTYTSSTPCAQDVRVVVSDGSATQEIATNDGLSCAQVLQGRTLQAGTYIVRTVSWGSALEPGVYTISGAFPYASFQTTLSSSSVEISVAA
jgi:Intracellular proteinase inhibitor